MITDKTILVTGGAGFIGSHLAESLAAEAGNRVVSLDNYFTGSERNHVPGVEYIRGHTKDIEKLCGFHPDLVYHLGEYSRVERSFEDIELVLDSNKIGTLAVLEFCRKHQTKLVYAGSSTKFAAGGMGRDQSPYAWTKATNSELVRNYHEWYGLEYATTYFYNVYGGREITTGPYGTVLGIFRELYAAGLPLTVVTPGTQRRNFTHVSDIVRGLLLVGEHGSGDDFGLGAAEAHSVLEIAELFGSEIEMLPPRRGNRLDATLELKKINDLGWSAERRVGDYVAEFLRKVDAAPQERP